MQAKQKEKLLLLRFSMNDSAKLNSEEETRCSNTTQTLNLNKTQMRIHCMFLYPNQQCNLSESLRRKTFLVSKCELKNESKTTLNLPTSETAELQPLLNPQHFLLPAVITFLS